eukprot:3184223-Prymnesium_polylepis.1
MDVETFERWIALAKLFWRNNVNAAAIAALTLTAADAHKLSPIVTPGHIATALWMEHVLIADDSFGAAMDGDNLLSYG